MVIERFLIVLGLCALASITCKKRQFTPDATTEASSAQPRQKSTGLTDDEFLKRFPEAMPRPDAVENADGKPAKLNANDDDLIEITRDFKDSVSVSYGRFQYWSISKSGNKEFAEKTLSRIREIKVPLETYKSMTFEEYTRLETRFTLRACLEDIRNKRNNAAIETVTVTPPGEKPYKFTRCVFEDGTKKQRMVAFAEPKVTKEEVARAVVLAKSFGRFSELVEE